MHEVAKDLEANAPPPRGTMSRGPFGSATRTVRERDLLAHLSVSQMKSDPDPVVNVTLGWTASSPSGCRSSVAGAVEARAGTASRVVSPRTKRNDPRGRALRFSATSRRRCEHVRCSRWRPMRELPRFRTPA